MPRHWSVRVLRAFLALWFVLSVGEPSIVHFCPMHGGLLGELAAAPGRMHMSGMGMPGRAASGRQLPTRAPDRHATDQPTAPQAHHHCTCIACCMGAGTAAALPALHVTLGAPAYTVAVAPAAPSAETLPRPAPPHAQPPGTGPPRA